MSVGRFARIVSRISMNIYLLKNFGAFGTSLFLACGVFATCAAAQTTAPILGEIAGDDISVLGPSHIVNGHSSRAITFGGGSTVIVHAGKARVGFAGGGELEICGPAKFSVLASGEALTVALSFGRVHVKFDASRPITIYTPLIVATPMAIGDQPRDATIGLMNTGAMCVLAARGAVQVQQQLSGETLVVPQPSEILLQGTSLGAAQATSGSCRCDFDELSAQTSAPPEGIVAQAQLPRKLSPNEPEPSPQNKAGKARRATGADSATSQIFTLAQRAIAETDQGTEDTSSRSATSPLLPARQPITKIDLPPIGYDATSATATAVPLSVATLMLAKEAKVEPEWIFHGTVAEPPRTAKPASIETAQHTPTEITAKQQSNKHTAKKSFWTRLHDLFAGSPAKTDCVGEGCS
ncbi:MAG TPA: hypothetical protein VKS00_05215 [Candidatus Acidoferrales bacterium]|nr:hypothetical protein [Candidatus Acidoferrales bacterium]